MTQVFNFEMRRGDTPTLVGYLKDKATQLPVNDPTCEYKLTGRATRSGADPSLFQVITTQFAAGEGRCPIPVSATSGFTYDQVVHYDMQAKESNGNVTTVLAGKITVRIDAAR
jgi:hypothetical protein